MRKSATENSTKRTRSVDSLAKAFLSRFSKTELEQLFPDFASASGNNKNSLIKEIIKHHFNGQMTVEQMSALDLDYQWMRLSSQGESAARNKRIPGAIKEWKAYELVFEEQEGDAPNKFSVPGPAAVARSDPRRLQYYFQQELDAFFENYCMVRLHHETTSVWIRIQLSEADVRTKPHLVYSNIPEALLRWYPTSDNTIYIVYFLNTPYFMTSPIKPEFKDYIIASLKGALAARDYKECDLKGPNFYGLKELLLGRNYQGPYRRFKRYLGENPIEPELTATKRIKTQETEKERRVVAEDMDDLERLYREIDDIFGLNEDEYNLPAQWKALCKSKSEQPVLNRLQIDIKAPFSGTVSKEIDDALFGLNLSCRVLVEGPNVIEGFKQLVSCNSQLVLPSKDGKQKIGLPDFIKNLHSLAKNSFSFDFTEDENNESHTQD